MLVLLQTLGKIWDHESEGGFRESYLSSGPQHPTPLGLIRYIYIIHGYQMYQGGPLPIPTQTYTNKEVATS